MTSRRKPFSTPSWVVGRDFPHPDTRPNSQLPHGSAPSSESIPILPPQTPTPTPPLYPDEGRAADPQQSAAPPAPIPAAEARQQQPPTPKPRKTRPPAESNPEPPTSNFHSGKCSICNHPDRAEIEAAFLNWEPADRIVAEFKLPARSTLYRHVHAADLLRQRRNNLLAALDHIIERAATARVTGSDVLNAIELSCRLSSGNIAPLRRYEVTHKYIHEPNPAPSSCGGGSFHPEQRRADPPGVRPKSKPSPQPQASSLHKQSGHSNIVAEPNSLISKEGQDKQSGHTGVPGSNDTVLGERRSRAGAERRECLKTTPNEGHDSPDAGPSRLGVNKDASATWFITTESG